jgi:succinoglycan biosynthesis transport protein ExoP
MERSQGARPALQTAIGVLWRRRWLFLGILVSIPVVVYVVSTRLEEKYETFSMVTTSIPTYDVPGVAGGAFSAIGSEELLVESEEVKDAAAEELGGRSIDGSVEAELLTTSREAATGLLQITATAGSGERAAAIADAYAAAIDEVRTGEIVNAIDRAMARLRAQADGDDEPAAQAELASQLQSLRATRAAARDSTETVLEARTPTSRISPTVRQNTMVGAVIALLLALGAVVVSERLDRRLHSSDDLEPLLDTPLLSVIPGAAFPGAPPAPTPVREAFRALAASLVYFNVSIDRPVGTVMVASPTKGDGKTTVAVHLAVALARDGQDVVLIDADMRHPQVGARLGIEPEIGLAEVITNEGELRDALVEVDVGDGRLRVLTAGSLPSNPARLLSSRSMGLLLASLSEQVDIVILDTPPLLAVSDAVPLLETVSGTVLVAKVGATSRDALQRMRQVIETARGNLLGAVATGSVKSGLYGYGGDYYEENSAKEELGPIVDRHPAAAETGDAGNHGPSGQGEALGGARSASEPGPRPDQDERDTGA